MVRRFGPIAAVILFLQQVGMKTVWVAVGNALVYFHWPHPLWLQAGLTAVTLAICCGALYYLLKRILHDAVTAEFAASARPNYLAALRTRVASANNDVYIPLRIRPLVDGAAARTPLSVMEAFEFSNRRLLLTGAPGSGKTTSLESLAWQLAVLAEENPRAPLPLLLSLPRFDLRALRGRWFNRFLSEELRRDFRLAPIRRWIRESIPPPFLRNPDNLINYWLDQEPEPAIVWLLDGLDEIPPDKAAELMAFLFAEIGFQPVAACCRNDRDLSPFSTLTAMELEPLDDSEIQLYLQRASARAVVDLLKDNASFLDLARKPLFLSVMAEVARSPAFATGSSAFSDINGLFDSYVTAVMQRRERQSSSALHSSAGRPAPFTKDQVTSGLGWLAATLAERRTAGIGKGGLAELLGRSARYPAFGFSAPLQLAISIVVLISTLLIVLAFQIRYNPFGGIRPALLAGCLMGLIAIAILIPVRFLLLTTELLKRFVTFGGLVKNPAKHLTPADAPPKGSPDRVTPALYQFLARHSAGNRFFSVLAVSLGLFAVFLGLLLAGIALLSSIAMLRASLSSAWLKGESNFTVAAAVVSVLLLLGLSKRRFALFLTGFQILGLATIRAAAPGHLAQALLTLLLSGLTLATIVMQEAYRKRLLDAVAWLTICAAFVAAGAALLAWLPAVVDLRLLLVFLVAAVAAGASLPRAAHLLATGLACAAVAVLAGVAPGAGSFCVLWLVFKQLADRYDLPGFFDRKLLSPIVRLFLPLGSDFPFRWNSFLFYAHELLLLNVKTGEIRFQHALLQDFFLSSYNQRRMSAGLRDSRHNPARSIPLDSDALPFSRRFLDTVLSEAPVETRIILLIRLANASDPQRLGGDLIRSRLQDQPPPVFRVAAGVAYLLNLDLPPDTVTRLQAQFIALLEDEDPLVRAAAVRALSASGNPTSAALLSRLLRDESDLVKLEALDALQPSAALEIAALRERDLNLQRETLLRLWSLFNSGAAIAAETSDTVQKEMLALARGPSDVDVRVSALQILMFLDSEESRQAMEAAAKDVDPFVRLQGWCGLHARTAEDRGKISQDLDHLSFLVQPIFHPLRELEVSRMMGQLHVFRQPELDLRLKQRGFIRCAETADRTLALLSTDLLSFLFAMARSPKQHGIVRRRAILLIGRLADQGAADELEKLESGPDRAVNSSVRMAVNLLRSGEPYPHNVLIGV